MKHISQSRKHSIIESFTNIIVGLGVSITANNYVLPAVAGCSLTVQQNVAISVIFTIISLIRSYLLRRAFNRWHVKNALSDIKNSIPEIEEKEFNFPQQIHVFSDNPPNLVSGMKWYSREAKQFRMFDGTAVVPVKEFKSCPEK